MPNFAKSVCEQTCQKRIEADALLFTCQLLTREDMDKALASPSLDTRGALEPENLFRFGRCLSGSGAQELLPAMTASARSVTCSRAWKIVHIKQASTTSRNRFSISDVHQTVQHSDTSGP